MSIQNCKLMQKNKRSIKDRDKIGKILIINWIVSKNKIITWKNNYKIKVFYANKINNNY
jgi:hypothetical protein